MKPRLTRHVPLVTRRQLRTCTHERRQPRFCTSLGSAAHAARAVELDAGGDPGVGAAYIDKAVDLANPIVISVLTRYPHAPAGGRRAGELLRRLDASVRGLPTRP